MQSFFSFVIALSVLIVIHEYGHFWVARRCGVKVLRFSVGFGKPIWRKLGKDGTEYVLAPFPLGGYVKMLDEREGDVTEEDMPRSFNQQSLKSKIAIVSAGPLANLLFAVVVYWALFIIGIPGVKPIIDGVVPNSFAEQAGLRAGDQILQLDGDDTPTWKSVMQILAPVAEQGGKVSILLDSQGAHIHRILQVPSLGLEKSGQVLSKVGIEPLRPILEPIIGEVLPEQAAEKAGLQVGDKLLSANGEFLEDWSDWVKLIQHSPGKKLEVSLLRNGQKEVVFITPQHNDKNEGIIGVAVDTSTTQIPDELKSKLQYSPVTALYKSIGQVWTFSVTTLKSLWGMLMGTVSTDNLGGPISIAQIAGSSAQQGFLSFINFLAMISITLGVLNLLPIPVLDGGHLTLFLLEWFRGKPLDEVFVMKSQRIGMFLLLSLMMLAFYNDLARLFG